MTPEALLAAAAGAGIAAGIFCTVRGALSHPPPTGRPPQRWTAAVQRWHVSPRAAAVAVAAGLATFAITRWPVAGIAAAPAAIALPRILSRRPSRARIAKLDALAAWTRRLADVLAASQGLEGALIHSAESAPAAIARPAQHLAARLQVRSADTAEALRVFAGQIDDPAGDLIASALIQAAGLRGPGLHAVLTELAADVAKDVSGRREVEAERASYRRDLIWIVGIQAVFLGFLVTDRSYSAPFGTPAGQLVLAAAAACWATGWYWMWRLAQMTGPQRFMGAPSPDHGRSRP